MVKANWVFTSEVLFFLEQNSIGLQVLGYW